MTILESAIFRVFCGASWRRAAAGAALVLTLPACGGAPASVVATGQLGHDVSGHADSVPQGAEVCALKDALAAPPGGGGTEKAISETCAKPLKSDKLWQRSMVVLGAYADTLDKLSAGADSETTGPLEAARTGVKGSDWIEVDDNQEKAAREAVAQLVNQMATSSANGDLEKAVKDAAPHIKTICDGLGPYIDAQAKGLVEVQKEIEKRKTTRNDRRCGTLDTRSVCVSESVIDRAFYAQMFGHAESLENAHVDAHTAVIGFCTAHRKLEDAAAKGDLSSKETYAAVVEAVKQARRAEADAAAAAAPPAKK
jgi:hypothetical protein